MASAGANGITLEYDEFGKPGAPPIVLIMGLGMQMIAWPDAFCADLAGRGFRVIRFDNRDAGLSTSFAHCGTPHVGVEGLRFLARLPLRPAYTLDDMAHDTAGLLDALGIPAAHLVGASMGGMIAQNLASLLPRRVLTLTSIMSTTGSRRLPKPQPRVWKLLLRPPAKPGDVEGAARQLERILRAIGSRSRPQGRESLRERCERHARRAYRPDGMARQLVAIGAADDRTALVRRIAVPTLVIHGDKDPLLPPECGLATARAIAGAELRMIAQMGHDLPEFVLGELAEAIAGHCGRVVV